MPSLIPKDLETVSGLDRFCDILSRAVSESDLFDQNRPIIITRAPGRLDLMGGIADYSGSLVLQYPIKEATFAAIQASANRTIRIESVLADEPTERLVFEASLDDLLAGRKLGSVDDARSFFAGSDKWPAYAVGALVMLASERKIAFEHGARILIYSEVPQGKGVSSSAAIEVAVMKAVVEQFGIEIESRELALLCQKVENGIVGAPCGVMDQMASAWGVEGSLIELLCQPAELRGTIDVPDEVEIWGIDSGIRHSVAGADYSTVRTAGFMGYRILAETVGLSVDVLGYGHVRIDDPKWNGYLASIGTAEFEGGLSAHLPDVLTGAEFLDRYGGVSDLYSTVRRESEYPVLAATAHPIYENCRVRRFAELLKCPIGGPELRDLGELMYSSHNSYSACGLGSDGTDLLVSLVREAGFAKGLYGAKITGGGSGGTVAILGRRGSGSEVAAIAATYEAGSGRKAHVFSGSSPGAFQFGSVRWTPA